MIPVMSFHTKILLYFPIPPSLWSKMQWQPSTSDGYKKIIQMDCLVVVLVSTEKQFYMRISTIHYHILAIQDFIPKQQFSLGSSDSLFTDSDNTVPMPDTLHQEIKNRPTGIQKISLSDSMSQQIHI